MAKQKIEANLGNLLTDVGRAYGNPSNAIKEYATNALDSWADNKDESSGPCHVCYEFHQDRIIITYDAPGMDEKEFREALRRVADSIKPTIGKEQIGQLGLGLFSFNQVGATCTFLSKKNDTTPTIKVVLKARDSQYDIDRAKEHERLESQGMKITISGLVADPTQSRGHLSKNILDVFLSEQLEAFLRDGRLVLTLKYPSGVVEVKPPEIKLPPIGAAFKTVHVGKHIMRCQFWFDVSGKGKISIRHSGVSVIPDFNTLPVYLLNDTIYSSGMVKGYIDADFLQPMPSRNSFEENNRFTDFVVELSRIEPSLHSEVDDLLKEIDNKKNAKVQAKIIEIANDILWQPQFRDLDLLKGMSQPHNEPIKHETNPQGENTGERSKTEGVHKNPNKLKIAYAELPFEDGSKHSEFVSGVVRVNELNPDFMNLRGRPESAKMAYGVAMVIKEVVAFNDKIGAADYYLEKMLSGQFQIEEELKRRRK